MIKMAPEKLKKPKKTPMQKGSIALLVFSVLALLFLGMMCLGPMAAVLLILPVAIIFVVVVIFPSVFSIGIIWFSEGYRNFIKNFGDFLATAFNNVNDFFTTLAKILPYTGSAALLIVGGFFALSLVAFLKHKEEKGYKPMMIVSAVFLGLAITFFVIAMVMYYPNK